MQPSQTHRRRRLSSCPLAAPHLRSVRESNIVAAKAVADAVRTSLGPRGMDKMVRLARPTCQRAAAASCPASPCDATLARWLDASGSALCCWPR